MGSFATNLAKFGLVITCLIHIPSISRHVMVVAVRERPSTTARLTVAAGIRVYRTTRH